MLGVHARQCLRFSRTVLHEHTARKIYVAHNSCELTQPKHPGRGRVWWHRVWRWALIGGDAIRDICRDDAHAHIYHLSLDY